MKRVALAAGAVSLAGVVVVAACLLAGTGGASTPRAVTVVDPDPAFVATRLVDWKNFGDAIASVRVVSERPDPSTPADPNENGGLYGRLVELRVEHVFWVRDAAHTPPAAFTSSAMGWFGKGGHRTPLAARNEPRLVPRHRYLMATAHFADGWGGLGGGAEVPFDSGVVGVGEWDGRDSHAEQPALDQLMGRDAGQVQAAIDAVAPDPVSIKYGDLEPVARAQQVMRAH